MIKAVTQNHGMGCGVACVAAVLNISYTKALKFFEEPSNAWSQGYRCRDIVDALNGAGKHYRHKYLKSKIDPVLKIPGTIVFTRFSEAYPHGHYLARAENGWMNPWVNFPEIASAKSAIVKRLPAEPIYAIYEVEKT